MRQNKLNDEDYPTGWEVLGIGLVVTLCVLILISVIRWAEHPYGRKQLDCSECHSKEIHETKKMVEYFKKQGYKEPKRWLK